MISFEEAYEIVMRSARPLGTERVGISNSLNRILAEDVVSDIDMPPFDKSAMDGYACRRQDLANELKVVETIRAGQSPSKAIDGGECAKIMTGAPVPQGADCVIMVEYTETPAENTVRFTGKDTRDNICLRAEDIGVSDGVLFKGDRIAPQHIAVLATVGCVRPLVARQPRVAVVATGDELVEPDVKPGPSRIRTSNSYQLCAQATASGAVPTYHGIARDTEEDIDAALKNAMAQSDVVVISGGVSMGDYDFVPGIMKKNNIEILFDSIAMKPGRPTTFGVGPEGYCFGLPGNPVSTFVQFELLVKPFLRRLMGGESSAVGPRMSLAKSITRKRAGREAWMPAAFTEDGKVRAVEYHGSAHVNALCNADCLLVVPIGVASLEEGTLVHVRLL